MHVRATILCGIIITSHCRKEELALEKLLEYAKKINKRVLFTIDEVTNTTYVKQFTSSFQTLMRENYPVFLLMTGLL